MPEEPQPLCLVPSASAIEPASELVEASADPALLLDARDRVLVANEAARSEFGARPGLALRRLLGDERAARRLRRARRIGSSSAVAVARLGRRAWEAFYRPLEAGGLLVLRRADPSPEAASDPLVRYGPLLERLPIAWALVDEQRAVRACNPALARLVGLAPEAIRGRPLAASLPGVPEDEFAAFDRRALAGEDTGGIGHVQDLGGGRKRTLRVHRIRLDGPPASLLIVVEDVTEQLRTADGIAVDGALVQTILDYMPGFISLKDARTRRFLFATGTDRVLADQPAHYLIGRSVQELYEPDLAAAIDAAETELLATPGEPIDRRFPKLVGEETRWFFSRKLAVPDAEGRPRYILTFNLDVTHEVTVEQALARANRFLDALFDTMPAMLAVRELEGGRLVRVNPSFCNFLGLAPEAILGRPIETLALGCAEARRADERALVAGEQTVADRLEPIEGSEGRRWLRTLEVVVRGEDGRPSHVLSLHYDVSARVVAEQRLAQSRAFLDTIVQHLPWALAVTDAATGEVLLTNPPGRAGLLARAAEPAAAATDPAVDALRSLDARVRVEPARPIDEEIAEPGEEGPRWHRVRKVAVPEDDTACRYLLTLAEDVTEHHRMLARLRRSEAILRRSQSIAGVGSWRWRPGRPTIDGSDEMHRLLGRAPQAGPLRLRAVLRAVLAGDRVRLRSLARLHAGGAERCSVTVRVRRLDGAIRHLSVEAELERGEDGAVIAVLGTAQDVTERIEAEARIRHQALHDYLTDLPNRLLFDERLAAAIAAGRGRRAGIALHCLDLNDFKGVNDTLGHAAGDALLRQVAQRLSALIRPGDLVCRLGGDEFAILQHEVEGEEPAARLAGRALAALAEPFSIDGHELVCTASIGVALAIGEPVEPGDLLRRADIALYAAKAAGRGAFRFFSPELNARLTERKLIEARLRLALERGSLELAFQPQIALRTGRIVGVEALVRWRDAELGQVPPDKFVAVAEDTGQIHALGAFVLAEACARAASWRRAGLAIGRVAVNLSPAQFAHRDLVETVSRVLRETGLPAEALELEITEGVLMRDRHGAAATLEALHAMGVGLALDDFGTGYSSLSYLKRFPIDKIKIDRSFVKDLPEDPDDAAIVRTIITLGKTLGLGVLAEGVETGAQRDFLLREGCDEAQGYLFARPLTAEQLETMLRDERMAVGA
ncbi:MAG: EAL domain-containing protein [Geminicoccaceae bacterium]|nr:EAL domain-containing protein [Geminicoccaceae bacterium]